MAPQGTQLSRLSSIPPVRSAGGPISVVWLALPGSIGPRGEMMVVRNASE
jgi:hypothetical protein